MASAKQLALDVEALVLPVACLGCDAPTHGRTDARVLCDQCAHALRPIAPPQCKRCGQTLDPWETAAGRLDGWTAGQQPRSHAKPSSRQAVKHSCGFCRTWPSALAWAASAVWFESPARELIHSLKYGGWRVAADPMAALTAKHLSRRLAGADLLVPIPLGRLRRRERGHNQAEELAREMGRVERGMGRVEVRADVLVRSRETRTQTELHPSERQANVRGAFEVRGAPCAVRGKNIVLVDDVLTTGATLCAAAEALAAAGAADVGAVTFARAAKPGENM